MARSATSMHQHQQNIIASYAYQRGIIGANISVKASSSCGHHHDSIVNAGIISCALMAA